MAIKSRRLTNLRKVCTKSRRKRLWPLICLAYPGIELADSKEHVDDKQTVTIDHFRDQWDQKQVVLEQDNTDTSVGLRYDGDPGYREGRPPGLPLQSRSSPKWRNKRLIVLCFLAIFILIVVVVPVGVVVSRNRKWVSLHSIR